MLPGSSDGARIPLAFSHVRSTHGIRLGNQLLTWAQPSVKLHLHAAKAHDRFHPALRSCKGKHCLELFICVLLLTPKRISACCSKGSWSLSPCISFNSCAINSSSTSIPKAVRQVRRWLRDIDYGKARDEVLSLIDGFRQVPKQSTIAPEIAAAQSQHNIDALRCCFSSVQQGSTKSTEAFLSPW